MKTNIELNLIVPVYNGGVYWSECWKSIKESSSFFKSIYLSINKSELQDQDIEIIDEHLNNVNIFKRNALFSARDHAIKILQDISINDNEFYMYLCHDDLLNQEGLKELADMKLKTSEAVFGSQLYFSDDNSIIEFKTNELALFEEGVSPQKMALMDLDKTIKFNISGIVISGEVLKKYLKILQRIKYGYRSDNLNLFNPWVKRVFQTNSSLVKIRMHSESQGGVEIKKYRSMDNLVYFLIQYAYSNTNYARSRYAKEALLHMWVGKKYLFSLLPFYLSLQIFSLIPKNEIKMSFKEIVKLNYFILFHFLKLIKLKIIK